jgi:hypothetical protein
MQSWLKREGHMRRVASFLVASALLGLGIYLLYFEVFWAAIIRGFMLMASGFLIAAGGTWLVNDFLLPIWRKTHSE